MQPHCQISGQKSLTKSSEWLSQHVMTMLQWNFKFYHVMFLRSLKAGRKILQSSCDCCYSHITYFTTCLFSLVVACRKWMTVETRKESKSQKQEENSDTMPGMHGFRAPATGLRRWDLVESVESVESVRWSWPTSVPCGASWRIGRNAALGPSSVQTTAVCPCGAWTPPNAWQGVVEKNPEKSQKMQLWAKACCLRMTVSGLVKKLGKWLKIWCCNS